MINKWFSSIKLYFNDFEWLKQFFQILAKEKVWVNKISV
jgi:hypothetical protein